MNLENLCFEVQGIAKIAGLFIAEEREKFNLDTIEVKGKANFVSYVDKQAEQLIVDGLRDLLPGSGFIEREPDQVQMKSTNGSLIHLMVPQILFIACHLLP